jgi:hypothetical protein
MPLNSDTKTRKQYLKQDFLGPLVADVDAYGDDWVEERATELLAEEHERIWAWAPDPETDLTQLEARDRAQSVDYGRHNLSQSSVSRKLSSLDEEMLVEPSLVLGREEPIVEHDVYQKWDQYAPAYVDAWRQVLARTICDFHALREAEDWESDTPDWAVERVPGLGDNATEKLAAAFE